MQANRSHHAAALPLAASFALIVAIGVVGRWGQPDWAVTPIAATGLLAGYALPRRWAVAAPLLAMLITDLALPAYANPWVAVTVYAAMAVPPLLGALMRRPIGSRAAGLARWVSLSASPAVLFFLATNFAVWATQSIYPKTGEGLLACYAAAVPFFKRMVVGDLTYAAVLFGAAAVAGAFSLRGLVAPTSDARSASA